MSSYRHYTTTIVNNDLAQQEFVTSHEIKETLLNFCRSENTIYGVQSLKAWCAVTKKQPYCTSCCRRSRPYRKSYQTLAPYRYDLQSFFFGLTSNLETELQDSVETTELQRSDLHLANMSAKKAHELLGVSDSEDEHIHDQDSDDEVAKGGRSAKRRKVDSDDEGDNDEDDLGSDQEHGEYDNDDSDDAQHQADGDEDEGDSATKPTKTKSKSKRTDDDPIPTNIGNPLAKRNLVATDEAIKKSGVVYLSRIPPFMKPIKLRSLLQPYGTINRIFLAPEDPAAHARRVRAGGNKKRSFTEGWVEFTRKRDAKAASELLNGRTIGGKKGSYYRDDLWNLLYLKGFKWHNLTEQIAAENAERTSRMRAEISKTTKENKDFVRNVERSKMLDGMEAKAKAKKKRGHEDEGGHGDGERPVKERKRTFTQVAQIKKAGQEGGDKHQQPEQVTRVLSKIF